MQTGMSKTRWAVLCTGVFLTLGLAAPADAGWWKSRYSDECDECPAPGRVCRRCHGRGCPYCSQCFRPVDPVYCDFRDRQVYSAQGYGVPVTVPLAPIVRTYNYSWGIPSTRLSRAGGYTAWNSERPFSQNGGRLPGGRYPTVYQPTDTTQFGVYYNYVPTWQPRQW